MLLTGLTALALFAPPRPLAPAPRSAAQDARTDELAALRRKVAEEVSAVEGLPVAELMRRSARLREGTGEPRSLDAVVDQMLAGSLSPDASLFLAACQLQGERASTRRLHDLLLPIVEGASPERALAAVDLLGSPAFRDLDPHRHEDLVERLDAVFRDAAQPPELRVACAETVHAVGDGTDQRRVRQGLRELLDDPRADLRGQVALALVRVGEPLRGPLEQELERLAPLATEDGRRARLEIEHQESLRAERNRRRELERSLAERRLPEDLRRIDVVMRMVQRWHLDGDKFSREDLVDAALAGVLESLDEHSGYLSSDAYAAFYEEMVEPVYGGIGAYIVEDPVDGLITVARPIYSGPAYRADLRTDDKIVRVEDWSTVGATTDEVVKRLKGTPGTAVRIYVWRPGMDAGLIERPSEDMARRITRAQVTIPSVTQEMLPGGIGMIELQDFNGMASHELRRALQAMMDQGLRGVVLDLRRNLGGILEEARDVSELFLPAGSLVAQTETRDQVIQRLHTEREPLVPADVPVVVLLSRYSASASEIVAGALQDHGRATIVGERSYGKGAVQTVQVVPGTRDDEFSDENENDLFDTWEEITSDEDQDGEFDFAPRVKITYARYVLPSGRSIHRELDRDWNILSPGGIEPDRAVARPGVEAWRLQERYRVYDGGGPRRYVDERWDAHQDLFRELAACDGKDPGRYPGFEELHAGLDTLLPADDVRLLLRAEIRRRLQDERGAELPPGDFQEDPQVQEAVRVVLDELGQSVDEIPAYGETFERSTFEPERLLAAARLDARLDPTELERARTLLREAREGTGYVSRDLLDRVLDLLDEAEREN